MTATTESLACASDQGTYWEQGWQQLVFSWASRTGREFLPAPPRLEAASHQSSRADLDARIKDCLRGGLTLHALFPQLDVAPESD